MSKVFDTARLGKKRCQDYDALTFTWLGSLKFYIFLWIYLLMRFVCGNRHVKYGSAAVKRSSYPLVCPRLLFVAVLGLLRQ